MKHWSQNSFFYHIYPLGLCEAPFNNDFSSKPVMRLEKLYDWIYHLKDIGVNALYIGPLFESLSHGYDTKDFFLVDRRLGDNKSLSKLIYTFHENGIKVILDGVFHHVGREFFAFKDLIDKTKNSSYTNWFVNVDFNKTSPYNDPFSYEGWNGHYNLVKLNLKNNVVKNHLFNAIEMWINEFKIDGLRLDAADYIETDFLKELSLFCKKIDPQFWLMGEVIHGDYNRWANDQMLDSTTNYECYKGLYSSFNDKNFFEIAYSLNRQFGDNGIYKNLNLYNFADNHDVNRIASTLNNFSNIFPLYCILFTMPGIPSIYYGSEWGIFGKKNIGHDHDLRPGINLNMMSISPIHIDIYKAIKKLSNIRNSSEALKKGNYKQVYINHQQFIFFREYKSEKIIVAINSNEKKITVKCNIPDFYKNSYKNLKFYDILNENDNDIKFNDENLNISLYPNWARIIKIF